MTGAHARAPRRRVLLPAAVALVGALGLMGGLGTKAFWTDSAAVDGATVYAGTLDLTVNGAQGNPTPYAWSALTLSTIAPGESTAASLTLANIGTAPFGVSATGTATGALAPYVTVRVVVGGTASTSGTYPRSGSCTGGTQAYNGLLSGTPATIVAAGTSGASLSSGGSTTLCVSLTLSASTPNAQQGAAFAPSFSLTATQS